MTLKRLRFVRFSSVTQMAYFAIALLGASAVRSSDPSCDDLRNNLLNAKQWTDNFSGQFEMGDSVIVQSTYFKTVAMQLAWVTIERVHRHKFSVYPSGESHPRVTVDGKSFKLHSLAISNLDTKKGTAALTVTFLQEADIKPTKEVLFVVPLLKAADDERNLNEDLSNSLTRLRATPNWGIKNIPFNWLQPILSGVTSMTSTPEDVKVFMTNCQHVPMESGTFGI